MRAFLLLALSCTDPLLPCGNPYEVDSREPVTSYFIEPTRRTPSGVLVDDPRGELDDDAADAEFDEWERTRRRRVIRCAVVLKVAPDWREERGVPVFPCMVEKVARLCRGAVQHRATVVVPGQSGQQAIPHELDHLILGRAHNEDAMQ